MDALETRMQKLQQRPTSNEAEEKEIGTDFLEEAIFSFNRFRSASGGVDRSVEARN